MNINQKLSQLEGIVDDIQKEVDEAKKKSLKDVVEVFCKVRYVCDRLAEVKSPLEQIKSSLAYGTLPEMFNDQDLKTQTYDELGVRVTVKSDLTVKTLDKLKALGWGKENGIVQETINSSTLKAFAKDLLKQGKELPSEMFETEVVQNISVTKV